MDQLIETLRQLDPAEDAHWTQNGLARLDVLSASIGSDVTRQAVAAVAPQFRRDNLELPPPEDPAPEPPSHDDMAESVAETRAILEEKLAQTRVEIESCRSEMDAVNRRMAEHQDEEIRINTLLQEKYPEISPGERMKRHVQRQHQIRMDQALKQTSTGQQPTPLSPLDRALGARPRPYQQIAQPAPPPMTAKRA